MTCVVDPRDRERVVLAIGIARQLLHDAASTELRGGGKGRRRRKRMARLVGDPVAKRLVLALTDEVIRLRQPARAAHRFARLVPGWRWLPRFGIADRVALWLGAHAARLAPPLVMPLVGRRLRAEMRGVTVPAEDPAFAAHLRGRAAQGIRCNVNLLGEAILGEDEAERRRDALVARLTRPDVDYVSVKLSSVSSHVQPLAFDATVGELIDRLRPIYAEAARHEPAKFVNLDMEEYHDLELTVAVFTALLDEPEFAGIDAGIVLQAYLPDAHGAAEHLAAWATQRHADGGGRIKVRVVKGANLAMERVEAELHGWPQAPYTSKEQVDASYKRLLDTLLQPQYDAALAVGLASHNLFDVAWGMVLRTELAERGAEDRLQFEMLEGMAEPQALATARHAGGLVLYTPVVARDDFEAAIAYLVRRLDENTSPGNFLTDLFEIKPGNVVFGQQAERFQDAVENRQTVDVSRRRQQDRRTDPTPVVDVGAPFANEPDTDFALAANREWVGEHLTAWKPPASLVAPVVAGQEVHAAHIAMGIDPSDPNAELYRWAFASVDLVDRAIGCARAALRAWERRSAIERAALIEAVAAAIAEHRGRALATMVRDAGKTVVEADIEVSEAIDFARLYARSAVELSELSQRSELEGIDGSGPSIRSEPLGIVVVSPPWNFPFAIPMGGVLAALAAGNPVILKPAPETVLTAQLVVECCWAAGVPREVLQFLPCADDDAGRHLISHADVGVVILTGAYATAEMFHDWRPDLHLHAETSGKNAMVISAAADIDLAIKDLVRSAFGHAGQKCSAASLAVVEAPLYDSPTFRARLADAVRSLRVGPSNQLTTDVGPLIRPPEGNLLRGLTTLDDGESWLVEPRQVGDNTHLWTPGVRIGVQAGSWYHRTECFGPVLGVMRATDLAEAIRLQNATAFGLTGGLHSLDPDEIERWIENVEVGNAYVNRGTTGAIVRRQPFGGWKHSAVGPTAKAGGPNYVATLRRWHDVEPTSAIEAERSFADWWKREFAAEHDPSGLRAESNVLRYRPLPGGVVLRLDHDDPVIAIARIAAQITGTRLVVSVADGVGSDDGEPEADEVFASRLRALGVDRLRVPHGASELVRRAAHAAGITIDDAQIVGHGRFELPHWLREQAVSRTLHRHGLLPG